MLAVIMKPTAIQAAEAIRVNKMSCSNDRDTSIASDHRTEGNWGTFGAFSGERQLVRWTLLLDGADDSA
jgi:hypothetical protein